MEPIQSVSPPSNNGYYSGNRRRHRNSSAKKRQEYVPVDQLNSYFEQPSTPLSSQKSPFHSNYYNDYYDEQAYIKGYSPSPPKGMKIL